MTDRSAADPGGSGRTLDTEIAEKVMGWKWEAWPLNPEQPHLVPPDYDHKHSDVWWWGRMVYELVPEYSTDITAAWEVLDAMVWRVGMANIRLDMEDYGRGAGTNGAAERAVWVTIGDCTAFGPAPEAICRAALLAVETQVP